MPPAHGLERTPSRLQSQHLLPWHRGRPIPREFPPAPPLPAPLFADLLRVGLARAQAGQVVMRGSRELPTSPCPQHLSLGKWGEARVLVPAEASTRPSLGAPSLLTAHLRARWCPQSGQQNRHLPPEGTRRVSAPTGILRSRWGRCPALVKEPGDLGHSCPSTPACLSHGCTCYPPASCRDKRPAGQREKECVAFLARS